MNLKHIITNKLFLQQSHKINSYNQNHSKYIHNPAQKTWVSIKYQGQEVKGYNPFGWHTAIAPLVFLKILFN